jgi:hypothetical protein
VAATLEANRAAALKRGITEDAYDRSLVDGITAMAWSLMAPSVRTASFIMAADTSPMCFCW